VEAEASDELRARVQPVVEAFGDAVGGLPAGCWAAPGRINIIGEHTDYNDGYVLPIALRQGVLAAAARRADRAVLASSLQKGGMPLTIDEDQLHPKRVTGWAAYPAGIVWALRRAGHDVGGVNLVLDGDIAIGGGLSSSAALECAVALACADLFSLALSRQDLAQVACGAENEFVGVPVGIMDPSASLLCQRGHALFLDTRTLESEQIPFDLDSAGLSLLVIDTRAAHRLADGAYANRREACEEAARILNVPALRDVQLTDLDAALEQIADPTIRRRVRHVVTENTRVLEVVDLLGRGLIDAIGPLLTASHESLRDDYEVSSRELDAAVDAALSAGALGARMTGAGFGGCAIALIATSAVAHVTAVTESAFERLRLTRPRIFAASAAPGARRVIE
jgi:galactokinase